jgi:hypothetical protein
LPNSRVFSTDPTFVSTPLSRALLLSAPERKTSSA